MSPEQGVHTCSCTFTCYKNNQIHSETCYENYQSSTVDYSDEIWEEIARIINEGKCLFFS